jgi:hypothetical protein
MRGNGVNCLALLTGRPGITARSDSYHHLFVCQFSGLSRSLLAISADRIDRDIDTAVLQVKSAGRTTGTLKSSRRIRAIWLIYANVCIATQYFSHQNYLA